MHKLVAPILGFEFVAGCFLVSLARHSSVVGLSILGALVIVSMIVVMVVAEGVEK